MAKWIYESCSLNVHLTYLRYHTPRWPLCSSRDSLFGQMFCAVFMRKAREVQKAPNIGPFQLKFPCLVQNSVNFLGSSGVKHPRAEKFPRIF